MKTEAIRAALDAARTKLESLKTEGAKHSARVVELTERRRVLLGEGDRAAVKKLRDALLDATDEADACTILSERLATEVKKLEAEYETADREEKRAKIEGAEGAIAKAGDSQCCSPCSGEGSKQAPCGS